MRDQLSGRNGSKEAGNQVGREDKAGNGETGKPEQVEKQAGSKLGNRMNHKQTVKLRG